MPANCAGTGRTGALNDRDSDATAGRRTSETGPASSRSNPLTFGTGQRFLTGLQVQLPKWCQRVGIAHFTTPALVVRLGNALDGRHGGQRLGRRNFFLMVTGLQGESASTRLLPSTLCAGIVFREEYSHPADTPPSRT